MIHFVGAGPGAPDLITLRGAKLLGEAGMIIYAGSLVNKELLALAKPGCAIYDSASMTLDEVVEKFREAEAAGVDTVRLHTGDPSIYGAIREQMDRLEALGIEYDVTPGVSSLPGVSQTVIITRMEGRTPVPEKEKIRSLASHRASMVMFLSSGMVRELCAELIAGGYAPETKAAMVYKASWPEQRVIRSNLTELPAEAEKYGIKNTALIMVGDFLGDEYELSKLYDKHFSHGFRKASA